MWQYFFIFTGKRDREKRNFETCVARIRSNIFLSHRDSAYLFNINKNVWHIKKEREI